MKKIKKTLLILILLGTIGLLTLVGIDLYVRMSTEADIIEIDDLIDDYDYILVLGAGIYPDGTPSPMLKERLDRAIEIYEENPKSKIIVSGDHIDITHDEVNAMKNYMANEGIPSNDIFMDHAGISTYDSLYRAKHIFDAKKVVVVTQKYHLHRALYIGKQMDLEVLGVDAQDKVYSGQFYRDIREFLARVKDFAKCTVKPTSKFGGDAVPVSKGGNFTNDKEYILIENIKDGSEIYETKMTEINRVKKILNELEFKEDVSVKKFTYTLTMNDDLRYELDVEKNTVLVRREKDVAILNEEDSKFFLELVEFITTQT